MGHRRGVIIEPAYAKMRRRARTHFLLVIALALATLTACADPESALISASSPAAPTISAAETQTAAAMPTAITTSAPSQSQQPTPLPSATPTRDIGPYTMGEAHCGILLPVVTNPAPTPAPASENPSLTAFPEHIRPAVAEIMRNPGSVGLVAYEVGREAEGIYINPDLPLPLASVVKVIHLIAYAQAVQEGRLDPQMVVPLADLERYYLPGSDLGAHRRALAALQEEERIFGEPPAVQLEDVPRMMMEFSSNAATDYLHMLLGQERIEETAVAIGLGHNTAPCPFLGQFLLMGRNGDGVSRVEALIQEPSLYSREVMRLTDVYRTDPAYREEIGGWYRRQNRPSLAAQHLFSEHLNARGTAREYAQLMGRIANNEFGPWELSVRIRRYLEWPTHFPANQENLAWLGYKGGSLPGVLTAIYYAQPWSRTQPVVVALFFHDLPIETYREWHRSLPHDELARWLLQEPGAIPALRALLAILQNGTANAGANTGE